MKRKLDEAIDLRLIDLLEDWEKVERCIPEIEAKLCRDAKLDLCELETELSQIERQVQNKTTVKGSSASLSNSYNGSVANFATLDDFVDDDEDEKSMSKKLLRMLGKMINPFMPDKKTDKKLQQYCKDSAGVAQKRAEKKLKALQHEKETLKAFVTDLMQRPFNFIHHLETKIPNMIKSNEMLLSKFEQDVLLVASSRKQYMEMMTYVECIRRALLDYSECYLFANDFDADDVQLFNKRDSVKEIMKRSSTSEEMEVLRCPYGLWTSGGLLSHLSHLSAWAVSTLALLIGELVEYVKKVREKSRECHNHKPQPFPDPKRKRKPTNLNKHKPNKRTKSTKISSLFPKRGNRNTKRTEKHKNKMTHGKTYNKSPCRLNHKATKSKTNTGTTALERSVEQTTGVFKALLQLANFTLGPDATLNTEIHKNSVRIKAPNSVNASKRKHKNQINHYNKQRRVLMANSTVCQSK